MTFRLYPPERLIALGRCPDCSFHPPTQGHRDSCQHDQLGHDAYRGGFCKACRQRPYRPGSTECENCHQARTSSVMAGGAELMTQKAFRQALLPAPGSPAISANP
jgi:hypothetical protein